MDPQARLLLEQVCLRCSTLGTLLKTLRAKRWESMSAGVRKCPSI